MPEPMTAETGKATATQEEYLKAHPPVTRPQFLQPFLPKSIRQKIGVILSVLFIVSAGNVAVVRMALDESNGTAATINVAGKLRFLSQQIALSTVSGLQGWRSGKAAAESSIHEYELALAAIKNGGRVFGYNVRAGADVFHNELSVIERDWHVFRQQIEQLLAAGVTGTPAMIAEVNEASGRMLVHAERLMQAMTNDAQMRQERSLGMALGLLIIDILILLGVAALLKRQIVSPLRTLAQHCRDFADGNLRARVDYRSRDEIGQLADTLNYSAEQLNNLVSRIDRERQNLAQAEAMFRGLAENSVVGVYIAQGGRFHYANAKMASMFGYEPEEMNTHIGVLDLVQENERRLVESNIERRMRGDVRGVRYERHGRRKDGSLFDVEVFGSSMELNGRRATIGIMLDITERKKAEAAMQLSALVYAHSGEGMTITDANGVIVDVNPAFSKITGYDRDEVIGRRISLLRSGRHDRAFYQDMWQALNATGYWQGEIWNRRKSGDLYAAWLTINTAYHPDGSVYRRIALFSDITQKKKTEDLIWKQANFDSLTDLPNRLMFRDRLDQEIKKAHRAGLTMALMFIDLDRFKEINDTLGHAVGDNLLKQASLRLKNCVRESDTVARLGGDEFTVILGELTSPQQAERVAQQILQKMEEPFVLGDETAYISASIGVTFYPDDATDLDDLLKCADQAMYAAKEQGRNRYHYFTASLQQQAQERRRIGADLHEALALRQFEVQYQPIVDLATGRTVKAEALLRWMHPERGMISPAEFIPIAEETGMIADIGDWVFAQAVQQLKRCRALDPGFQISVNVSPLQFRNGGIEVGAWFKALTDAAQPIDGIVIEITEGLLLDTSSSVKEKLERLRAGGMQVALDDFGTGYSSLSYLNRLQIDYLKIDRSFVIDMLNAPENLILCDVMARMANRLGIKVVAEGIETAEQRTLLKEMGCEYGQGFLFSRSVTGDRLENVLRAGVSAVTPT